VLLLSKRRELLRDTPEMVNSNFRKKAMSEGHPKSRISVISGHRPGMIIGGAPERR
jgi:hypothetical protein